MPEASDVVSDNLEVRIGDKIAVFSPVTMEVLCRMGKVIEEEGRRRCLEALKLELEKLYAMGLAKRSVSQSGDIFYEPIGEVAKDEFKRARTEVGNAYVSDRGGAPDEDALTVVGRALAGPDMGIKFAYLCCIALDGVKPTEEQFRQAINSLSVWEFRKLADKIAANGADSRPTASMSQ